MLKLDKEFSAEIRHVPRSLDPGFAQKQCGANSSLNLLERPQGFQAFVPIYGL
jgi:hypothetical protein